ncbi:hypothetical protein RXV86_05895 [Alisedimentitalea sp. MJ-SS2]|uniref:hypothetical protein n=1 Tax=Aliisedimentitalea sp. MJ-SS2 TaxID=3049795 RepID=UPI00290A0CB9|nr:hypothetical protein [Alisedimentitalea sp. MJ-SS2]MDU8926909.1 hypothetical protein [Alisedimentitalea sp. MJ-SS2]
MNRRAAVFGLIMGVGSATQALAFGCAFTTECYEAEGCNSTGFNIEVNIEDKAITTDYGDLQIVAVKEARNLTTMFATGAGAEYMLSLTPTGARFTTHNNSGPEVISYLGTCKGAF